MEQLVGSPTLLARVDVLLWEQHWFRATSASTRACGGAAELCIAPGFHAKKHVGSYQRTTLSATVAAFRELRQRGVIAHYWY